MGSFAYCEHLVNMEGALIAVILLALYSILLTIGILGYFGFRHYKHKKLKGSDTGGHPTITKAIEEGRAKTRLADPPENGILKKPGPPASQLPVSNTTAVT